MKKIIWNVIFIVLCIPTFIKVIYWTVTNSIRRKLMEQNYKEVNFKLYCNGGVRKDGKKVKKCAREKLEFLRGEGKS